MGRLRYHTFGESHGPCVGALVEGMPAGVPWRGEIVDAELARRQGGYGRGARMRIEQDRAEVLSGVAGGTTLGTPILLVVKNKDDTLDTKPPVYHPRPGHADLAGVLKYGFTDARKVLERASARETAGRVAAGGCARMLLEMFDIDVFAHVVAVGGVNSKADVPPDPEEARRLRDASEMYCIDPEATERMKRRVDEARKKGDTLGGVVEVIVRRVPPGLGSHVTWRERLDGRLCRALAAIQAIKGVEIGLGFEAASRPGSSVHDGILPPPKGKGPRYVRRSSNNAGGIEGGMTNGCDIVLRAAMKPIATLMNSLPSIDLRTMEPATADCERSDVCAVPAASVVAEAVVAIEVASAFLEKFGGDCIEDVKAAYEHYIERISST